MELQSWGEGGHLQGDALPQLLGLLAPLEVLQDVVELHHAHRRQAEGPPGAADDVDEVIVVGRRQVDEPVVDVLQRWTEKVKFSYSYGLNTVRRAGGLKLWLGGSNKSLTSLIES